MKLRRYFILCMVLFGVISCEKDTTTPDDNNPVQMGLKGLVQKGPFITGSTIEIQELNDNMSPNGTSFNVSTEDNFGSFTLESEINTDFIEIISTGFYFNEVSGQVTNTNLTLRAISPVENSVKCNVNILTTLAKKRLVYLVNEENKTFLEAKLQSQNEILSIFSISPSDSIDFEKMDISADGDENGILLAVSAILQGTNTVSELSLLISTIIEDIKTDGILDNNEVKNEIIENAKHLFPLSVRKNIEERYRSLGLSTSIPNFEQYINNVWPNSPPTCEITRLECVQGIMPNTYTVSYFAGKPLVIGSKANLGLSSTDTDGQVKNYFIYLDEVLVDSLSTGSYTWTITDTTKHHSVKAIAVDDEGARSLPYTINYELYGKVWEYQSTPPFTSADFIGTLDGKIISLSNKIYTSTDCIDWTLSGDAQVLTGITHFLNKVCKNKIWKMNQPQGGDNLFIYNSTDGINWQSDQIIYPGTDGYMINYDYGSMFSCNDDLYLTVPYINDMSGNIYKLSNDSMFVKYKDYNWEMGLGSTCAESIDLNGTTFLYNALMNAGSKVMCSNDGEVWTLADTNISISYPSTRSITVFEDEAKWLENTGGFYTTTDGLNWEREVLLAPSGSRIFSWYYDNKLWIYNMNSIYSLKKYFD